MFDCVHGQEEHASIASFSRFALDLLRFAAPPSLIEATHAAAIDEVRHARLAFQLAAHFRGQLKSRPSDTIRVGSFPLTSVNLSKNLSVLASRTLVEGCIGESTAAVELAFAVALVSKDAPSRSILLELLADEARHAALAWATLHWAFQLGADVGSLVVMATHDHVSEAASMQMHDHMFPEIGMAPGSLTWGGRVPGNCF